MGSLISCGQKHNIKVSADATNNPRYFFSFQAVVRRALCCPKAPSEQSMMVIGYMIMKGKTIIHRFSTFPQFVKKKRVSVFPSRCGTLAWIYSTIQVQGVFPSYQQTAHIFWDTFSFAFLFAFLRGKPNPKKNEPMSRTINYYYDFHERDVDRLSFSDYFWPNHKKTKAMEEGDYPLPPPKKRRNEGR